MSFFVQRVFLALCLIYLPGCRAPACRQWEIQEILTQKPCFNAGRLLLCPESAYSHLELEIMRNRSGIRFYINLLFLQAVPLEDDSTRTHLEILFEDQEPWIVFPYLFEGGQRMLLPDDIANSLILALLNGQSFTIQIGRSHSLATVINFSEVYQRLLAIPIE